MALFYRITTDDSIRLSFLSDMHARYYGTRPSERELISVAIERLYNATCGFLADQLSGGDQE